MTEHRKRQLETLLRKARQRVFEDARYERVIDRCKARLGTDQLDYGQNNASALRWANTMWM